MRFIDFDEVRALFKGKTIAVVGSAPSVLDNDPGFIDSHDIVVRINNHKCGIAQGFKTDAHYAFYGTSIKRSSEDLRREGCRLCMCKLPNAKPLESKWHEANGKQNGIDFRYVYRNRASWWFTDTYIPSVESFMTKFELLDRHIPTTGFSAILDVLRCDIARAFITGFDFFSSGLHNVDENWRPGDPADPIGHRPVLEAQWLEANASRYPLTFDPVLTKILGSIQAPLETLP